MKLTALQKEIRRRKGDKNKKRSREKMEEQDQNNIEGVVTKEVKVKPSETATEERIFRIDEPKKSQNTGEPMKKGEEKPIATTELNRLVDEVPKHTEKDIIQPDEAEVDKEKSEFLRKELQKRGIYDETLSLNQQAKLLNDFVKSQAKQERYNKQKILEEQVDKEITLDDITNNQKDKLVVQLRVLIKLLVKEWDKSGYDPELLFETKKDLVLLLYKLRSDGLTQDMITSLSTICYYIQQKQYMKANESYMKLSIGNIAWPIGLVSVGIHARSALHKIEDSGSNIMIDDKTRRWITGVKRLITFKETHK